MTTYDVAVIGGGPAGLSAALVLTRARRRVAVIDAGAPRNAPATHLQGFLSRDGMPPAELLAAGYGGHVIDGTVVAARACGREGFRLSLADGRELSARRLLVTTGLHDELPDLPGVRERWGRDLLHCPYCHGHEVRDQPLGVLGGSSEAVAHALLVRQWSSDVVFFVHTGALTTAEHEQLTARVVGVVEGAVRRLVVEGDRLQGVELEDGRVVPRTAVFVRPRFVPHGALLDQLGCATHENGWVVADPAGHTTVPGVWAAGNAVNPRAQVVTAVGEGSAAGIDINADLVRDDVTSAVRDFRAGLPA